MKTLKSLLGIVLAAFMVVATGPAAAADVKKPDGTVAIHETDFALILGGSVGGGKLTYKGKAYDFKIGGLTAGLNAGITRISATGEVFDLKDVAKFPGTYLKFDMAGAVAGGGAVLWLKNEHGVIMKLTATAQGFQFNVGSASGVKVTMQ